jgi:hypothetical protein
MRITGPRWFLVASALVLGLLGYLCFSNIPLVPAPGGGPSFSMYSYLPVGPRLGRVLVAAKPVLTFPVGTTYLLAFRTYAASTQPPRGWRGLLHSVGAPFGLQSQEAVRLNLAWLAALNFLAQVALVLIVAAALRRIARRTAA